MQTLARIAPNCVFHKACTLNDIVIALARIPCIRSGGDRPQNAGRTKRMRQCR